MTLTINLPAELEGQLQHHAAAAGQDVEAFVRQVVTNAISESADIDSPTRSVVGSAERFRERLDAWTKLHPVLDHAIDDSREAIYSGRGE